MGRVCPTFVAGRWVGAEFFEENPSFGGSGEQVGHRGFGSPGKLKVRITVFPIPEHGLFFLSQSAIVSELFRLVVCSGLPLWGNGKAASGVCPQLASPFASYRVRANPGVCLLSRGGSRQRVGPREACPSGQVDRAPRGGGGWSYRASGVPPKLDMFRAAGRRRAPPTSDSESVQNTRRGTIAEGVGVFG